MAKFFIKRPISNPVAKRHNFSNVIENETKHDIKVLDVCEDNKVEKKENNSNKKENEVMMTTQEKINAAANILGGEPVKKIKRDKGLIERAESSMTILTEDNKELLKD